MILKQTKGHQIYNDNVDHVGLAMQSYNHAKFERSCCDGVRKKSSSFFFQQGNMSIISLDYMRKNKQTNEDPPPPNNNNNKQTTTTNSGVFMVHLNVVNNRVQSLKLIG